MPSLRLNIGLNGGRKLPFGGGAAPSGIPTATTTIINISSTEAGINSNFYKSSPSIWYDVLFEVEFSFSFQWKVQYQGDVYIFNTLPNQTEDYIPLTGWSPADTTITIVE